MNGDDAKQALQQHQHIIGVHAAGGGGDGFIPDAQAINNEGDGQNKAEKREQICLVLEGQNKDNEISRLNVANQEKDNKIQSLVIENQNKDNEIARLNGDIQNMSAQFRQMQAMFNNFQTMMGNTMQANIAPAVEEQAVQKTLV